LQDERRAGGEVGLGHRVAVDAHHKAKYGFRAAINTPSTLCGASMRSNLRLEIAAPHLI
jgi:hypothetical protein